MNERKVEKEKRKKGEEKTKKEKILRKINGKVPTTHHHSCPFGFNIWTLEMVFFTMERFFKYLWLITTSGNTLFDGEEQEKGNRVADGSVSGRCL